ncbi:MAG: aminoacyl-tRNA hydrolase [Endomicrobium sp.]|nr:aminoacyl-tRNA hydrolase [Endomicrobium sp.]
MTLTLIKKHKKIKLFVGIGNPGEKYKNTRHNLGFDILDEIALEKKITFKKWKNIAYVSYYKKENNDIVWVLKPILSMNLSGIPLMFFLRYYQIKTDEFFLFYDDISIPIGKYKIKMTGTDGGHNGVKSIIKKINSINFPRMKIGVGNFEKNEKTNKADFVLKKFNNIEIKKIQTVKKIAIILFNKINIVGIEKAISKNEKKQ